jgi:hypothetical protein
MNRSAQPFPSGARTKAGELSVPAQPCIQLVPERHPVGGAERQGDRAKAGDVLVADPPPFLAGLDQRHLKAGPALGLAEADEHGGGTITPAFRQSASNAPLPGHLPPAVPGAPPAAFGHSGHQACDHPPLNTGRGNGAANTAPPLTTNRVGARQWLTSTYRTTADHHAARTYGGLD